MHSDFSESSWVNVDRIQRLSYLLLTEHQSKEEHFWPWLDELKGRPAEKKPANKFLLGCVLDYQIKAKTAWANARRLAENVLGDPDDLWDSIIRFTLPMWMSKWEAYSLHRFPKGHERVWRIGKEIVTHYEGDARQIWSGLAPSQVISRLHLMRVGEQISRMTVGALCDTGQISGTGDVKADRHVCRVLGRVIKGSTLSPLEATEITRRVNPENPWALDRPLFRLGQRVCREKAPRCAECFLQNECLFYRQRR